MNNDVIRRKSCLVEVRLEKSLLIVHSHGLGPYCRQQYNDKLDGFTSDYYDGPVYDRVQILEKKVGLSETLPLRKFFLVITKYEFRRHTHIKGWNLLHNKVHTVYLVESPLLANEEYLVTNLVLRFFRKKF